MTRFDDRASRPGRGPADMLRWKLLRQRDPAPTDAATLARIRPGIRTLDAATVATPGAVWLGHASFAVRLAGKLILTDPIFATRLQGVIPRLSALAPGTEALVPDVITVSHDHMDHMDFGTLRRLPREALYVVPLGNGARLTALGKPRVVELDWWQSFREEALEITLVPARHWSMRMPWTRNQTLWGGFVLRGPEGSVYHAGDTAAGDHYAAIRARVGAPDLALLPIGAYSPRWFMAPQHQCPEEAGEGFQDLGARTLVAMHWGTYRLTDEPTGEPPARLRAWASARDLPAERVRVVDVGEAVLV